MHIVYEEDIFFFQKNLLEWYKDNGRSFLWRNKSASNYQIIISEIFLQRTRAENVASFLPVFFQKYSSWSKLSKATVSDLQEVLRPIGLYRQKGTRLYKLAQDLKKKKGRFPTERKHVAEMSGIGEYITNAYELYILRKRSPLLDVNMARLLERFFGPSRKTNSVYDPYLQTLAYRVVDVEESLDLNWAILDYGAAVCKKLKPRCNDCLLNNKCLFWLERNLQT